ncbi:tRNA (guanosine(37)-N1)-methyltransferase TrmD [Candidatus Berkelbacteria bacterium]|nr:tRNA (guanosine(37)-N1)-methyltransferase TrmD [Candidatus Berkelbacteria bacterium]
MKFTILTLHPKMIEPFLNESILGRAQQDGKITIDVRNLRDWATDKHKTVDDTPYGGGAGMVIKVDVVDRAIADIKSQNTEYAVQNTILLTPKGETFDQKFAQKIANKNQHLILIAGHYEGFDERIFKLVDQQISIGNFVLTGGELPAAVIIDAVARLIPGVLGNSESLASESHSKPGQLDHPHYTKPDNYTPVSQPNLGELVVPDVLKSGDHQKISDWRSKNTKTS